jgi:hypothetical protein
MITVQDFVMGTVLAMESAGNAWERERSNTVETESIRMKKQHLRDLRATAMVALACVTLGWAGLNLGGICQAQTPATAPQPPSDLPPAVSELVKLAKAGLSEDVILAKIKNDGLSVNLTTDQIIYLSGAGMSQNVIAALMQSKAGGGQAGPAAAGTTNPAAPATAEPPPLDAAAPAPAASEPAAAPAAPAPAVAPAPGPAPQMPAPAPAPAGLLDNFASDAGLNPALWTAQSDLLMRFAAVKGCRLVLPALAFGTGGMQMSGLVAPDQMMGIQSVGGFMAPFTFSATAVGMAEHGVPFEVSLVSADMRQWVTVAGHLGGPVVGGEVRVVGGIGRVVRGRLEVPVGVRSPNYGVWLNYTGSGLPISSLGYKFYEAPLAGVPYTVQVVAGADGTASVALLDAAGLSLGARSGLPVGSGPFYVLLAGRDGPAYANWQLAQLTPPAPPAAPVAAVPETPTLDYFREQLTAYGQWVEVPGAGLCWQPAVAPGWRPYYDGGHWVYTDEGWYWQSEYAWGDIVFHYGRWSYNPAYGWLWAPGFEFAPAWVVWRHTDEYCGWAPLPFGTVLIDGEWRFRGARVAVDFDFGLSAGFFSFVACDHFWEHDFRHFIVPRERLVLVFGHSTIINRYHLDHGRFVNEGIRVERMAQLSHRDVHEIKREVARDVRMREARRNVEVRHEDHKLAATGHKVEATRPVSASRTVAKSETERSTAKESTAKTATKESTAKTGTKESTAKMATKEESTAKTATKESTSKTATRESASKTKSSQGEKEKEKK